MTLTILSNQQCWKVTISTFSLPNGKITISSFWNSDYVHTESVCLFLISASLIHVEYCFFSVSHFLFLFSALPGHSVHPFFCYTFFFIFLFFFFFSSQNCFHFRYGSIFSFIHFTYFLLATYPLRLSLWCPTSCTFDVSFNKSCLHWD